MDGLASGGFAELLAEVTVGEHLRELGKNLVDAARFAASGTSSTNSRVTGLPSGSRIARAPPAGGNRPARP